MKRFAIIITVLLALTLAWLAIVLNAAVFYLDTDNESRLYFKNVTLQFNFIYILGAILFFSYGYVLLSEKYKRYF